MLNPHASKVPRRREMPSLGGYAFRDCSSLTLMELPASLTSIGEYAFEDCSSMTSCALPAGLTSLGEGAFYGCDSLTSIALPATLKNAQEMRLEHERALDEKALRALRWRQVGSSTDSDSDGEL